MGKLSNHQLFLLSSLALIQPLTGSPNPQGSTAPWYSDYDIEEYIYADYSGDYYAGGEEVKKLADLCFPDPGLNHQAIHLLKPIMGLLASMEKKEEGRDMQRMTASIMEQAANFSLIDTRFPVEGKMVSMKEMVQWGVKEVVEEVKEMGRCFVYGGDRCKGGRKGWRSGGKSSEESSEESHESWSGGGRGGWAGSGGGSSKESGSGRRGHGSKINPRKMQKMVVETLSQVQGQMLGMQVMVESLDLENMLGEEFLEKLSYMQKEAINEMESVGLTKPKLWGESLICVYDWLEVNANMSMPVRREQMAEMVEEMVMASNDMVETLIDPDMPSMVQKVTKGALKGLDMGPGRLDNLTMSAMLMLWNTKSMVQGLRVKEMMEKMRDGEKRIMKMLEDSEWKKVEGVLDMLVMMVSSNEMWIEADKEVKVWSRLIASSMPPTNTWAVPHMVNQALGDPAGGGEWDLIQSDPMFRFLALLQNVDEDLEVKMEGLVREMVGCAESSLVQLFTMMASLTEEEGMACMMEQMGMDAPTIKMMGQMGSTMAEEMLGKEKAPSALIMEVVNMETEMQEIMFGSCSTA